MTNQQAERFICTQDYIKGGYIIAKAGEVWKITEKIKGKTEYYELVKNDVPTLTTVLTIAVNVFPQYFKALRESADIPNSYQFKCTQDYQVKGAHEDIITLAKQDSVWFVGHNNNINNTDIFLINDRVTIGIPKFLFNEYFKPIFTDFDQWVDTVEERMFMTAKFKELGKENDLIFQALTFTGEASQKLSIATTILARDAYVSDAMKTSLKDLQQQLHDFSELLRTVPRVDERNGSV